MSGIILLGDNGTLLAVGLLSFCLNSTRVAFVLLLENFDLAPGLDSFPFLGDLVIGLFSGVGNDANPSAGVSRFLFLGCCSGLSSRITGDKDAILALLLAPGDSFLGIAFFGKCEPICFFPFSYIAKEKRF